MHLNTKYLPCRVALLGLGIPAAAVAQCKQYVVQIPCEAEAGLHKLRTKLEGSTVRGMPQPLSQAIDELQVMLWMRVFLCLFAMCCRR